MNDLTVTEPANADAIRSRILTIRGVQVMLDRDLAELYGVPTKRLNEQVKRNARRFPDNFMFQLTKEELADWRSQIVTSNLKQYAKMGVYAFTEHGIIMLASVLKSDIAMTYWPSCSPPPSRWSARTAAASQNQTSWLHHRCSHSSDSSPVAMSRIR